MILKIDGEFGKIPVALTIEVGPDNELSQLLNSLSMQLAGTVPSTAPAEAAPRKRRKPTRRISKAKDGRVEVSAPEMNMLKHLPEDGSPIALPELAEKVWPGRTARDGGPLVGPAARVAGGLLSKELATIEGTGGGKTVSVVPDWQSKAVEVKK
ncbi:hypothetical protein KQI52_10845 [bacterium]|nr:hypothetical protein [bacterium]